jgi:pimeloyl-ACP methyl ester carboxylesterase
MPTNHPSTRERRVPTNGIELHLVEAGPEDGEPVVLCHGFPELSYSWRHQIPALADAGYRVLAPDQRGYGESDKPGPIEEYDIHHLTGDLLGLLDDIGADDAVFVGHDWGSMVVGQMALLHPDHVRGVVAMSVPLLPRGPMSPITLMRQVFGDSFFYILYFQEPGVADADLGADARETMTRMLAGLAVRDADPEQIAGLANPDGRGFVDRLPEVKELPDWLSQKELDHYVEVFTRTGFTGGINWYRNFDRNWETTPQLDGLHVAMPSAFITGTLDPVNMMSPAAVMDGHVLDHRGNTFVEGAGHWVQQEAPDEVNAALLEFLGALDEGGR